MEKDLEKIRAEIEELTNLLLTYDYEYYVLNQPSESDAQYDRLLAKLKKLEQQYPQFALPYSPTKRVGGKVQEGFVSKEHYLPMLSLENADNEEDVEHFLTSISKEVGHNFDLTVEYKFDGLAVSLIFEDGLFSTGITRGDGFRGEVVTENLRTIRSIPLKLRTEISGTFEVRGEVIMPIQAFNDLNSKRLEQGLEPFRSPRNAASGSVRVLDPSITASRKLEFYAYHGFFRNQQAFNSHSEAIQLLRDLGFLTSPLFEIVRTKEEIMQVYRTALKHREDLPFEVDGLVIKVNSLSLQLQLGERSKSPRWAIAFKFPPAEEYTQLQWVDFQVGRSGLLTPVAHFKPVFLSGAKVSKATLHNFHELKRKDIRLGDIIIVRRQGDVIPYVVAAVKEKRTGEEKEIEPPGVCPACGAGVVEQGKYFLACPNPRCAGKLAAQLEYVCSRDCLDLQGFGEKICSKLVDLGLVKKITDLFYLTKQDFLKLEGVKEKLATKLFDEKQSKISNIEAWRVLCSFGIPNLGKETAKLVLNNFELFELEGLREENFLSIEGVGPEIARSLVDFFKSDVWLDWKRVILEKFVLKQPAPPTGSLSGKKFVFTGALKRFSRDQASQLIENLGGKVVSSVSKNVDYVVVGENPGSKFEKAKNLGIAFLREEDLVRLLNDHGCQV